MNQSAAVTVNDLDAAEGATSDALWAAFDQAVARRAETLTQLEAKLAWCRWALVERDCAEQAAEALDSALADLRRRPTR